MRPLYFGDSRHPLFGAYHDPQGERVREVGVLICNPGPQEYMSSHWALRKQALTLAREGFHVLRFDYYGCGDSAGQTREGTLERWRQDIAAALEELKDLAGVRRVCVVGFRLGAALAAQATIKVKDLVLWEPVVDGRAYLDELRDMHARVFAHCLHPPEIGPPGNVHELMGFGFPIEQERATAAIDLTQPFVCRAERVLIVATEPRPQYVALHERLAAQPPPGTAAVEWVVAQEASRKEQEPFLLLSRSQEAIAARLGGRPA